MGHYPEIYVLIVMVPELVCDFAKHKASQKWFLVGTLEHSYRIWGSWGNFGVEVKVGRPEARAVGGASAGR